MTHGLAARVDARLRSLREAGLLRTLRAPSGIDLSSNDYLDLARDPRVVAAFQQSAAREGAGSTGSRLLRGHREVFVDVERVFAAFKGADRALYFSSGYLANLGVLTTLPEAGDVILSDERNHASLIDAMRLSSATRVIVPHNDLAALETALRTARSAAAADTQIFVVVESVFSMDGDAAPLAAQAALCRTFDATLVVDEAHGVGLFGARGSGMIEAAGVDPNTISINSAGKALGVSGAFVAGPGWAIDYLVQRARTFVFSTAPPPAVAGAIAESLRIVAAEPERRARVIALARLARERLAAAGIDVQACDSPIVPILIGDSHRAAAVADRLQARGFDIRAIRPPTVPDGGARLRLSVNARLEDATIVEFVAALSAVLEKRDAVVRGYFVTGTDTGVGKTVAAAALMLRLRSAGPVRYWKPIQTGVETDDDTATVERLGGCAAEELWRPGIRLERPVSPHLAARLAGTRIDVAAVARLLPDDRSARWIVEGAGGVLVPVNESELMTDLMTRLALPVIVVSRSTLGTINHTLLTIEALRRRLLEVAGVIMAGPENTENRIAIEHYGGVEVIGEMPPFDPLTPDALRAWARTALDAREKLQEIAR